MFNLKQLKESLAACHITESSLTYRLLKDVSDPNYFVNRARECLGEIQEGINVEKNLTLAIQLLNIRRVLFLVSESVKENPVEEVQSSSTAVEQPPPVVESKKTSQHDFRGAGGICKNCLMKPLEIAELVKQGRDGGCSGPTQTS